MSNPFQKYGVGAPLYDVVELEMRYHPTAVTIIAWVQHTCREFPPYSTTLAVFKNTATEVTKAQAEFRKLATYLELRNAMRGES